MITYLTKTADGKTHHFRTSVQGHEVCTIQGVFYNWLQRDIHHYENHAAAKAEEEKLIKQKLTEGFQLADFEETAANNINIYDQANYHYGGDFPGDLDHFQAYVHTGMYLGWLIDNNLVSGDFMENLHHEIHAFKDRTLTGTKIYESCCDGILMLEDLTEEANRFSLQYFDFEHGQYLQDYDAVLAYNLPSAYHVADTWENYAVLKEVLDKRFADWKLIDAII